jgi:transcriptional regulator with XRE-family HTH domain
LPRLLTQAELAEQIGSTQVEVSRWESGEVRPRLQTMCRLCAALGVAPAALLGDQPPRSAGPLGGANDQ